MLRKELPFQFVNIILKIIFNLLYGAIQNFLPFIHQNNIAAYFFHLLHAVGAENDGTPVFGKVKDFFFYKIGINRVQATKRLI